MVVQQPPQGGGRDTRLTLNLPQHPRLGDQPVHQICTHPLKAECGRAVGGALLGGALALAGERLAAWERLEMMLINGLYT
jgi:hypothetical protein